jgi:hypothetical protein
MLQDLSKIRDLRRVGEALFVGAPKCGLDAGGEFVGRERFDHIVVETGLEAFYNVLLALASRQHNDGEYGEGGIPTLTDGADELQPVDPGHVAVGDQEVRDLTSLEEVQSLAAILHVGDLVTQAEELGDDDSAHYPVIIGYQYARALEVQKLSPLVPCLGGTL